jgi:hypothetical protein
MVGPGALQTHHVYHRAVLIDGLSIATIQRDLRISNNVQNKCKGCEHCCHKTRDSSTKTINHLHLSQRESTSCLRVFLLVDTTIRRETYLLLKSQSHPSLLWTFGYELQAVERDNQNRWAPIFIRIAAVQFPLQYFFLNTLKVRLDSTRLVYDSIV